MENFVVVAVEEGSIVAVVAVVVAVEKNKTK